MAKEFRCPTCGKTLSPNAKSCGSCGAKRDGGQWFGPEAYDGLGLGDDDDFDYEDFLRREFGGTGRRGNWFLRMTPRERFWWVVAVVLLLAFVSAYVLVW